MQAHCTVCLILLLFVVELVIGRSDLETLLEVKKGFKEDHSGKVLNSWDSKSLEADGCPRNWYGITCSEGHVTSIVLNGVGLIGKLDFPAISSLKMLRNLSVANNQLRGNVTLDVGFIESLENLDLSHNMFSGSIPLELTGLKNLVSLNLSMNDMEGEIPYGVGSLEQLSYLDLHSNALLGNVTGLFAQLGGILFVDISGNKLFGSLDLETRKGYSSFVSKVKYLNISHNNMSGELFPHGGMPSFDSLEVFDASYNMFVGKLPSFNFVASLQILRLGNNKLSGSPPQGLLQQSSMILFELDVSHNELEGLVGTSSIVALLMYMVICKTHQVDGGMENCAKGSTLSAGPTSDLSVRGLPAQTRKSEAISSSISPTRIQYLSKSPKPLKVSSPDKIAGSLHLFDCASKFSADDLSCAPAQAMGTSCHGTLYKAVLESGHVLAVKWLKEGTLKNSKDFAREVKKLGNIRHPNIVSFIGYYWGPKDHERLILSNYVDSPCLALYLHHKNPRTQNALSLTDRLKIAVDVARCLCYLHHEIAIPHGNLKSTNVLVGTSTANTVLTDYSLHRIMTSAGTSEQILTAAALGYRPPEFASMSKPCPSLKSDVYAFGVILLELLTGKSASGIVPGMVDLTEWVRSLAALNRSLECFDPFVVGVRSADRVYVVLDAMLHVALSCIFPADERPDMRVIFEELSSLSVEDTTLQIVK
ncbi:unnamed protein product [Cuscuta epithymum]|uniref:Protein kinase domain-containing protein n=1 Tax=Cuscuta epithymum TaxID=186058 RepID=A0AAV0FCF5_9ASTE|nr:unnamed protein product [Cuscuta epithymum]